MKRSTIHTQLKLTLIGASIAIVLLLAGTQQTVFAQNSQPTPPASSGERKDDLAVAEARLLKVLDALEKAEAVIAFKDKEIAARANIEALYKQAIEVKDLIIKYQDEYIQRLQKNSKGFVARLKQILAIAEKVALIALGGAIGRGL